MGRFIELNLFENADGVITCLKMLTRADEYTSKLIRDYKANGNNGLSPPPSNSLESPDSLGIKSELREEKRREEKRKRGAFALNESAWQEWLDYRKKRKLAKYATDKVKNQLRELEQAQQEKCIENSITQNYNGLFPENFKPESTPLKTKSDTELLELAETLHVHTQGKNRFQLIQSIEAKQ